MNDQLLQWLLLVWLAVFGTIAATAVGLVVLNALTGGQAVANLLKRLGAGEEELASYWQKRREREEEEANEPPMSRRQLIQMQVNSFIGMLIGGSLIEGFLLWRHQLSAMWIFGIAIGAFTAAMMLLHSWLYRCDQARVQNRLNQMPDQSNS